MRKYVNYEKERTLEGTQNGFRKERKSQDLVFNVEEAMEEIIAGKREMQISNKRPTE